MYYKQTHEILIQKQRLMNTYLKYQPPGMQFVAFMGLGAGFIVITNLITSFFFKDVIEIFLNKEAIMTPAIAGKLKLFQFINSIFSFIVPAFLFGYFSTTAPIGYLGIRKNVSPVILILAIFLMVAVQPFATWLGGLNAKVDFGPVQETFKAAEAQSTKMLNLFLKMGSPFDLLLNLLIMAVLPAIGEELFFRGSLQKVLLRWIKTPWLSILISSFVFALMHLNFFKILPIFTLGIMLGTVYYVTRNLWYCILIHFLNNATAVLLVYYADKNETIKKMASDNFSMPFYSALLSIIITVGIIYFMKKESDKILPAYTVDDDKDLIA
jgi:membrane protease YdiL (CAAX protease family)